MAFFSCSVIGIYDYHTCRASFTQLNQSLLSKKNTAFRKLPRIRECFHEASHGKNLAAAETGLLGLQRAPKLMVLKGHLLTILSEAEFFFKWSEYLLSFYLFRKILKKYHR